MYSKITNHLFYLFFIIDENYFNPVAEVSFATGVE